MRPLNMICRRVVLVLPVLAGCSGAQPVQTRAPRSSEKEMEALERRLFEAVNQRRKQASVLPLVWSDSLAREARRHSIAMVEGGFFDHRDPVRGDLARRLKESDKPIPWRRIAENIFRQRGARDPVAATVEGWMNSPGHRKNMLDSSYTDTGVGFAAGGDGTYYTTQIFALMLPLNEQ